MNIFSKNLLITLKQAISLCQEEKQPEILPEHLMRSLRKSKGSIAYDILTQIRPESPPEKTGAVKKQPVEKNPVAFHESATKLIEEAGIIALKHRHSYIGTEHLLAALLNLPAETLKKITKPGFPIEKVKNYLLTVLNSSSNIPNFSKIFQQQANRTGLSDSPENSALEYFTINFTDAEFQKDVNPVIGRENELERMIQILSRKDKNNPVILGDAGIGKTALIEGLAKKILEKKVPAVLMNKKILNLDLGSMVAGTMYRGDFENRVKMLIEEVQNDPSVILFIDELHTIIGAGSANGSLDTANLLKPLLARGKLRCIGATTQEEYKKHIESDPALERRFQPIYLAEPSEAETIEILNGIKENYQRFHGVAFTDEALEQAVRMSARYIQDKLLPDKAIDLIDEAAAKVKIKNQRTNKLLKQEQTIAEELKQIRQMKEASVVNEDFNSAIKLKEKEKIILEQYEIISKKIAEENAEAKIKVTPQDILELLAQKTGIHLSELSGSEYERMTKVKQKLNQTVIGQENQIEETMKTITQAQLGLADETKPMASFLFLGASGVGKTFFAQKLAEYLFRKPEAFIQLDMSEFHEKFQTTKLIGAPAGYVGYREANKFTDLVKKNPYSLILLDEIEKAHPEVLNLFLQILEQGHLTDSIGKKINFKNTVIVMTSNILAEKFSKKNIGFGDKEKTDLNIQEYMADLKKHFKPELVNRIGKILFFNELPKNELEKIMKKEITALTGKLKEKGINLSVSKEFLSSLAASALAENSGARGIKSIIRKKIEEPLMEQIMLGKKKTFTFKKPK